MRPTVMEARLLAIRNRKSNGEFPGVFHYAINGNGTVLEAATAVLIGTETHKWGFPR
jgi:hypothetical protein